MTFVARSIARFFLCSETGDYYEKSYKGLFLVDIEINENRLN